MLDCDTVKNDFKIEKTLNIDPYSFRLMLVAKDESGKLGHYYLIHLGIGQPVTSSLESRFSGRGIPRKLVENASAELESIANQTGRKFTHLVTLATNRSCETMPHILLQNGYKQITRGVPYPTFERIYVPLS